MFCPSCQAEYSDGVAQCPECGVGLVTDLSDGPFEGHEYEEVLSTTNAGDASLIRSVLDAEGINYQFTGEPFGPEDDAEAMRLRVQYDQADAARALITDLDLGYAGLTTEFGLDDDVFEGSP